MFGLWRGAKNIVYWESVFLVYTRPWFPSLAMQNNNKKNVSIVNSLENLTTLG